MGVSFLPEGHQSRAASRRPHGLPVLRPPSAHRCKGAHPPVGGRGVVPRAVDVGHASRLAGVRGPGDLPGTHSRRPVEDGPLRSHRRRDSPHRGHRMCPRRPGFRLHGRQHGQCGRRTVLALRGARRRRRTARRRGLQLGRGAHAGGHSRSHADGQDDVRGGSDQRGRVAVRVSACRSVHRRGTGELRLSRRHLRGRARGAAEFLRTAGHR